jgi:hypothetical protein
VSGKCTDEAGSSGATSGGTSSASGGTSSASGGKGGASSGGTTTASSGGSGHGGTTATSGSAGATDAAGSGQTGGECVTASDCASGLCVAGHCEAPTQGTAGAGTSGPHFDGSGKGFRPLTPGCGPETAAECTGDCEQRGGDPVTVIRPPATLCFKGDGDATPDDPSAVIEQVIERKDDVSYVHIRVTFDPSFTDTTFGDGACCGWPTRRGHSFGDLAKSDHTELQLTNTAGDTVMNFKIDLISADPSRDCGYGTLGALGGDGSMILGNASDILATTTSLDRNLNGCGYCKNDACAASGDCTVDSPPTDTSYTPNPGTPNWDYRVVYEVWIALDAFGDSGFGQAFITYTHSSPSKSTDTIMVTPTPCPPEWDKPYCPPSVIQEGGNCFGSGGSGGMGSGGGTSSGGTSGNGTGGTGTGGTGTGGTGTGGTSSGGTGGTGGTDSCPPNYQTYITSEGASTCTPIPFANYDGMKPCPTGYTLDLASEGQYCVPTP